MLPRYSHSEMPRTLDCTIPSQPHCQETNPHSSSPLGEGKIDECFAEFAKNAREVGDDTRTSADRSWQSAPGWVTESPSIARPPKPFSRCGSIWLRTIP